MTFRPGCLIPLLLAATASADDRTAPVHTAADIPAAATRGTLDP